MQLGEGGMSMQSGDLKPAKPSVSDGVSQVFLLQSANAGTRVSHGGPASVLCTSQGKKETQGIEGTVRRCEKKEFGSVPFGSFHLSSFKPPHLTCCATGHRQLFGGHQGPRHCGEVRPGSTEVPGKTQQPGSGRAYSRAPKYDAKKSVHLRNLES
jgi:hypothetical protein